jgi:Fe-S-cluster containining protein
MTTAHDCQSCGACCAGQLVPIMPMDRVPYHLLDGGKLRREHGRCVALVGQVGRQVSCSIYEIRPAACRTLPAGSEGCEMIRACCAFLPRKGTK